MVSRPSGKPHRQYLFFFELPECSQKVKVLQGSSIGDSLDSVVVEVRRPPLDPQVRPYWCPVLQNSARKGHVLRGSTSLQIRRSLLGTGLRLWMHCLIEIEPLETTSEFTWFLCVAYIQCMIFLDGLLDSIS